MTNQNNAAQSVDQEFEAIMEQAQVFASAWAFFGGPFDQGDGKEQAEREEARLRDVIRDALSKLRAPLADERAAFEAWNSKHGQYRRSDAYLRDDNGRYLEWPVENGWRVWQGRAALASAPVAGETKPAAYLTLDEEGSPYMLFFDVVEARTYCALGEEPEPLFRHAAPQASEAECSCPSGNGSLRHPCAVHPQAGRDKASLGIPDCGGPLCGPAHHHPLCRVATGDGEEY